MLFTAKLLPQAGQDIPGNMLWWAENPSADEAVSLYETVAGQIHQIVNAPES